MSANQPTSFRYPFSHSDPETDKMGRLLFNGVLDVNNAIVSLTKKVNAIKAVPTAVATTTPTVSAGGGGGGTSPSVGGVNDQTGNTSYILQQTDFGSIVILNTASPFALDLNGSITAPFYCVIENLGTGLATLTPDSPAVVNGVASVNLPAGQSALVYFDGRLNWWMTTLPPLAPVPLVGVSTSIGGSAMTAGQTVSTTVTITGAAVGMVATCSPETYPGDGFCWDAYISAAGVVTVRLTATFSATPTSSVYDVRVIP